MKYKLRLTEEGSQNGGAGLHYMLHVVHILVSPLSLLFSS